MKENKNGQIVGGLAMITEDYVSFETAKLLKEKWFDIPCGSYFVIGENKKDKTKARFNTSSVISNRNSYKSELPDHEYISCPTLQMAMKWLRKKYFIYADPIKQGNYNDCSEYYTWIVARMGIIHRNSSVADKLSYEQACEAALKYSLENLI